MAKESAIHAGPITRFREAPGSKSEDGLIEVHIIRPGWGSSGYYSESVLQNACTSGVYPKGMHMHWDHPTLTQEAEQPARTLTTLSAVLTEAAHYETEGWDGPGPYAIARVFPEFLENVRALDGHIGISHYVSGSAEEGKAPDGKRGRIITELIADALNTVDFVTVPGAGGSYRTMFTEAKSLRHIENANQEENMPDEKLTLSEVQKRYPEAVNELRNQLTEELKIQTDAKEQAKKLTEANDRIKALEQEKAELKRKVGEAVAAEFVKTKIAEAKIPEVSAKILAETLIPQAVYAADGSIDAVAFGKVVEDAIKAKQAEIEALLKETQTIHDNGGTPAAGTGDLAKAKEGFIRTLMEAGYTKEQAEKLAEA